MALGLAVYLERKTLLWSSAWALAATAVAVAKGWVSVPEPVNSLETPIRAVGALVVTIVILLLTRIWTGVKYQDACSKAGERSYVPFLPSSIPFVGHALQLVWDVDPCLKKARDAVTQNIFGLNLLGTRHVVLGSPSLVESIAAKETEGLDDRSFVSTLRKNIFGFPTEVPADLFERAFTESNMELLSKKAMSLLKEHVPDLITFNESFVDQQAWERASLTTVVEGHDSDLDYSDTTLDMLLRDFSGHIINSSFAGIAFMDDYPAFNENLQSFESKTGVLGTGHPRWVPVPGLPAGYIARRTLLANMDSLQKSYERELGGEDIISTEEDVGDFSAAFTASRRLFAEQNVSSEARSSAHLYMFWALNSAARDLVFWMMIHILAEPGLAGRVLEEARPFARATRPQNGFGMMEPPRIDVDLDGLRTKCPLLLSCYMETVRLYNTAWSISDAKQDVVLSDKSAAGVAAEYVVRKGEHVAVSNALLNTDSQHRSAEKFVADRFVVHDEKGKAVGADWGRVRHDNGMWRMAGLGGFAQSLCLATVPTVLGVWTIAPVDGPAGWKIPRRTSGPLTARPKGNVRVRIGRAPLASE